MKQESMTSQEATDSYIELITQMELVTSEKMHLSKQLEESHSKDLNGCVSIQLNLIGESIQGLQKKLEQELFKKKQYFNLLKQKADLLISKIGFSM